MLESIRAYFGVGSITKKGTQDQYIYRVFSLKDLKIIVAHFDKYPLVTQKRADFEYFKEILDLMDRKEHTTTLGLEKIVALRANMNKGLPTGLAESFPNLTPSPRPLVIDQTIRDPN
jgi:hypothetical protein